MFQKTGFPIIRLWCRVSCVLCIIIRFPWISALFCLVRISVGPFVPMLAASGKHVPVPVPVPSTVFAIRYIIHCIQCARVGPATVTVAFLIVPYGLFTR